MKITRKLLREMILREMKSAEELEIEISQAISKAYQIPSEKSSELYSLIDKFIMDLNILLDPDYQD